MTVDGGIDSLDISNQRAHIYCRGIINIRKNFPEQGRSDSHEVDQAASFQVDLVDQAARQWREWEQALEASRYMPDAKTVHLEEPPASKKLESAIRQLIATDTDLAAKYIRAAMASDYMFLAQIGATWCVGLSGFDPEGARTLWSQMAKSGSTDYRDAAAEALSDLVDVAILTESFTNPSLRQPDYKAIRAFAVEAEIILAAHR